MVLLFIIIKKNGGHFITFKNRNFVLFILWLVNLFLFYLYSRSGWSYRYRAFLISISLFVLTLIIYDFYNRNKKIFNIFKERTTKSKIIFLFVVLFGLGYGYQFYESMKVYLVTPLWTTNIYEQQYQMAMFINRYYQGSEVALTDIGAVNYFSDIKCLDLWGLGNLEVSKLIRNNDFTKDEIDKITKNNNVKIAIVYNSWFQEGDSSRIPDSWYKAGEWTILNNVIAGDSIVSIYAVDNSQKDDLIRNLRMNSKYFPATVIQSGNYMKP